MWTAYMHQATEQPQELAESAAGLKARPRLDARGMGGAKVGPRADGSSAGVEPAPQVRATAARATSVSAKGASAALATEEMGGAASTAVQPSGTVDAAAQPGGAATEAAQRKEEVRAEAACLAAASVESARATIPAARRSDEISGAGSAEQHCSATHSKLPNDSYSKT
eukprot:SAG11_NODE_2174_length_3719_cov_4.843094_5_plen_168_part_00